MRAIVSSVVIACVAASSCGRPARSGDLIEKYARAECVPPLVRGKRSNADREWHETVRLRSGESITIAGAQMAGGVILVTRGGSTAGSVAISAGDYVYPADVRVERSTEMLYVKADGLGGGVWQTTVLFEYDLARGQVVARLRVDPSVLPAECSPS